MTISTSPRRGSSPKQKQRPLRLPVRTSRYWGHGTGRNFKQLGFLGLDNLEVLYGGAAGGGKSDALLMAALQYVDVSGYSALLLRKTYPELSQAGGLIDRSMEWLGGTDAHWNEQKHRWTFPSSAVLEFGYLQRSTDRFRYQSSEYDFIGFDELTHFTEEDYRYLFSRLRRRKGSRIPPRMRGASNPGNRGHRWVKDRFIDSPVAGRLFIPAKLADNPGVDETAYLRVLEELDPQTRAQLLDGDWNAREPGAWVFDSREIDAAQQLGRELDEQLRRGELDPPVGDAIQVGIDWGLATTHAVPIWPLPMGGVYVPPREVVTARGEPGAITEQILEMVAGFDWPLDEARYDAAGGQAMATFEAITESMPQPPGIYAVAFAKRKDGAIGYMQTLFDRVGSGERVRVIAISPSNEVLLTQLRSRAYDDKGKVIKGDDHGFDSLIAGVSPIERAHREAVA